MEKEPRKASDVLLDLESKIENLINVIKSQDLNIKIISNKLNSLLEKNDTPTVLPPKITVEAVSTPIITATPSIQKTSVFNDPRQVQILAESKIQTEQLPTGVRRTSRQESKNNLPLNKIEQESTIRVPAKISRTEIAELPLTEKIIQPVLEDKEDHQLNIGGSVPVMQRIVDKTGKSVFLADVEIIDIATNQLVFKTRTSGIGKWMASLGVGNYRILIHKRESISKSSIEITQEVQIDGKTSPLTLATMIIK